ncbi:MAG TPA: protein-L-isoaspartate O-methyltransferase [Alphaproteobacteria bacterium]|jgi:protein-L-isoaspartate(D-aspartate) O-methyltransferase
MDFSVARRNMVDNQIRPNKVTSLSLLQALLDVPRERFVPEATRDVAYVDDDVPVGGNRWLMEPMLFARLVQSAEIEAADVVLDVGCVTGYGPAVLSRLSGTVVALEQDAALARAAGANVEALGIDNVALVEGTLTAGCPAQAPFNVILLEGAVHDVPAAITDQLAEGGRLVGVVDKGGAGQAVLIMRRNGVLSRRVLFDAATPRLPGFTPQPSFVF